MITQRFICIALNAALCASVAGLAGCNQQPTPTVQPAGASSNAPAMASTTAQAPVYTPPSADELYQMVAPIALFPDKLVAQVLAGSTYPDQVTAADNFLAQNQSLQGSALQDQVNPQAWDPSIKGLTVFPKVLDQMAQNLSWTTSLGEAYVNDPTDVLNAIQVMRQRASKHGSLHSSSQMRVVDQPVAQTVSYDQPTDDYPPTYSGSSVIPAPQQSIEILSAQPNTVYVPSYDPQTVYGEEVPVYPGYSYQQPVYYGQSDDYSRGQVVTTGVISFGVGILVGALLEHSHSHYDDRPSYPSYGWNSWGMNWGGGRDGYRGNDGGNRGNWQRPAVVHNNTTYVSRSTTVVNHYVTNNSVNNSVNNSNNGNNSNNRRVSNGANGGENAQQMAAARMRAQADGRHALVPTASPMAAAHAAELARLHNLAARTPATPPDFRGALTKGEPTRFSHLDPKDRPAAAAREAAMASPKAPSPIPNHAAAVAAAHAVAAHTPKLPPDFSGAASKGEPTRFSHLDPKDRAAAAAREAAMASRKAPSPIPNHAAAVAAAHTVAAHTPKLPPNFSGTASNGESTRLGHSRIESALPTSVQKDARGKPVTSPTMPRSHLAPRIDNVGQVESTGANDEAGRHPQSRAMPQSHLAPRVSNVIEREAEHPQPKNEPVPHTALPTVQQIRRAEPAAVERRAAEMERPHPAQQREAPVRAQERPPIQREQPRPEAARQAPAARPAAAPTKKSELEKKKKDEHQ